MLSNEYIPTHTATAMAMMTTTMMAIASSIPGTATARAKNPRAIPRENEPAGCAYPFSSRSGQSPMGAIGIPQSAANLGRWSTPRKTILKQDTPKRSPMAKPPESQISENMDNWIDTCSLLPYYQPKSIRPMLCPTSPMLFGVGGRLHSVSPSFLPFAELMCERSDEPNPLAYLLSGAFALIRYFDKYTTNGYGMQG